MVVMIQYLILILKSLKIYCVDKKVILIGCLVLGLAAARISSHGGYSRYRVGTSIKGYSSQGDREGTECVYGS